MSGKDKTILLIAVVVGVFLFYHEFAASPAASVGTPNALGLPSVSPSTLAQVQTGTGLFGNVSGLGSNGIPQSISGPAAELPQLVENA